MRVLSHTSFPKFSIIASQRIFLRCSTDFWVHAMTAIVFTNNFVRVMKTSVGRSRTMKEAVRIFVCTVAIAMVLLYGIGRASAQSRVPRVKQNGQSKVTDAGGRVHLRPKPRISEAQRKAAAKRREAFRARAVQSRKREIR